jgi:hypothetical protein
MHTYAHTHELIATHGPSDIGIKHVRHKNVNMSIKELDAVFSQDLFVHNIMERCKLLAVSFGMEVTTGTLVTKLS